MEGCNACARRKSVCQYEPSVQCKQKHLSSRAHDQFTKLNDPDSYTSQADQNPYDHSQQDWELKLSHNYDTLGQLIRPGEKATYTLFVLTDEFASLLDNDFFPSTAQHKFMRNPIFSRLLPRYIQVSPTSFDASTLCTVPINTNDLFKKRTLKNPNNINAATVALRILQSYPRMLLRKNTFPPFVHPEPYPHGNLCGTYPAPLENAISICCMLYRVDDARMHVSEAVEKAIRTEVKTILQHAPSFSDWDLLACLQALTVYCILRSLGVCKDLGTELLVAVNATCSLLVLLRGDLTPLSDSMASDLSWKDWIFAESRRRTAVTFRSLNALLNISIGFPCPVEPSFAYGPLPASKALWRATNPLEWDIERHASGTNRGTHGTLLDGELAIIRASEDIWRPQRVQWSQWLVGADELGMLVLSVAGIARDEERAAAEETGEMGGEGTGWTEGVGEGGWRGGGAGEDYGSGMGVGIGLKFGGRLFEGDYEIDQSC